MPTKGHSQTNRENIQKQQAKQSGAQDLDSQIEQMNLTTALQRARADPHSVPSGDVLQFQRTVGNRVVQQMLQQPAATNVSVIQRVNGGRRDKPYENDMLRGGPATVKINLNKLWELWQSSQRDANIHQPAVAEYVNLMSTGGYIDAPFLESITISEDMSLEIRSSDGRHRFHAAKKLGYATVYILKPAEASMGAVEAMGVKDELFPA
jgi:hypothetical protein